MMVKRFDVGTITGVERTPQGGLRIPSRPTRAGVLLYRNADGTERHELRPPEEVFKPESLKSLKGATVTDLHPDGAVSPDNYKRLTVGHVSDDVSQDGSHVSAPLVIQDAATIGMIHNGERKELSCGYSCDLEDSAGVYEGTPYNAIQRNIVYNHVALGPSGWGRAGSSVALRLDSGDAVQVESKDKSVSREATYMKTERIDGIEYEIGSVAWQQAKAKHDSLIEGQLSTLATEKARADTAEKALKVASDRADASDKALKAATDPKTVHAAAVKRADLLTKGRAVAAKLNTKFDADSEEMAGESDDSVLVKILAMIDPEFKAAGQTPDFIQGYAMAKISELMKASDEDTGEAAEEDAMSGHEVEGPGGTLPAPAPGRSDSIHAARARVSAGGKPSRTDEKDNTPEAAQARMHKDSRGAWELPLSVSRKD